MGNYTEKWSLAKGNTVLYPRNSSFGMVMM